VRPADALPRAFPFDFAADRACGVFDERQAMPRRDRGQRPKVTRHTELVHRENRFRPWSDCGFDEPGINVQGRPIDVDEDRDRTAIPDGVSRWQ
jgi:hypothetical protein